MSKTRLMGAVVAILMVGCGSPEPTEATEKSQANVCTVPRSEFCEAIEQTVDSVRDGLGSCTPNYMNQEPLAFNRHACDDQLNTLCDEVGLAEARKYMACLQAVPACDPAQQTLFDEAIDHWLDTFQNSDASAYCIELVVGD